MDEAIAGPIHAFLISQGRDGRGRTLAAVLDFDDGRIESTHDFIQWLFPLREASQAVPGAPVLGASEAETIRRDRLARAGLLAARYPDDAVLRPDQGVAETLRPQPPAHHPHHPLPQTCFGRRRGAGLSR